MRGSTLALPISKVSFRDTWAEVSLDAIFYNTSIFKKAIESSCLLMAVVKADGYGHGSVEVAKTAIDAGADYLGVAFLDEALVLRKGGITAPILILGYTPPESIEEAIDHQITVTVFSHDVLDKIITYSNSAKKQAIIHLKVDTGMGRVGVTKKDEALSLARKSEDSDFITLEGIFTHFSSADGEEPKATMNQFTAFKSTFQYLEANKIEIPIKHCCNSAGTIRFPEMHLNMVRVGISLYGLHPSEVTKGYAFPLEQALHFKTKIAAIKTVQKGSPISYGRTFIANQTTKIATLPVGYADGLSRQLSNQGQALVKNTSVPIVGRVCMDQTMIDVSLIDCKIGDEVILFGGTEVGFISIDEVAEKMGTINYEVVCSVMKRVPRNYIRNNEIVASKNLLLGN